MAKHANTKHSQLHKCYTCGEMFNSKDSLEVHKKGKGLVCQPLPNSLPHFFENIRLSWFFIKYFWNVEVQFSFDKATQEKFMRQQLGFERAQTLLYVEEGWCYLA